MKKYIFIAAALATAFLAGSCQKEKVQDSITLSTEKSISAVYEADSYDVVFTTNVAWTATTQATAGDVFFALDKTSGAAGTATLKLSVEKNEAIATRTGIITITAGTATQVINIIQDAVGSTSEDQEKSFDFLANEFEVAVKAKPSQVIVNDDWVKYVADDDKVYFAIERNPLAQAREALVKIIVVKHTINLKIVQAAEAGELSNPSVSYIGCKALPYDKESGYTTFGQYQLAFETEKGAVVMVITTDPAEGEIDPTSVPEGLFEVDASGKFADETFAIAGDYPTMLIEGENIYDILDGEIEITKEGNTYSISAILEDEEEMLHSYSYTGELGTVKKDDFGSMIYSAPTYTNQYTYYRDNKYVWTIELIYSAAPAENSSHVAFVTFTIVTPEASGDEFPTGTFTYEYFNKYNVSPTGCSDVAVGSFCMSGNDIPQNPFKVNGTPTLVVSKDNEGNYTFAVTSNLTMQYFVDYDEYWSPIYEDGQPFDWNATVTFAMPKVQEGLMAAPNTENYVITKTGGATSAYSGMWFGDAYSLEGDNNAFVIGWTYLNDWHTLYLTFDADQEYNFVKNYGSLCTNPIKYATYNFSETAAADALLPTQYCYFLNGYTNTKYMINGGSFTLAETSATFDLTAMDETTGDVVTIKGTVATSLQGTRNQSTRPQLVKIRPVVGPEDN